MADPAAKPIIDNATLEKVQTMLSNHSRIHSEEKLLTTNIPLLLLHYAHAIFTDVNPSPTGVPTGPFEATLFFFMDSITSS